MASKIRFQPNEPQLFKLVDPEGEWDDDIRVGRYQTTDGRELALPRPAVIKLNEVAPKAGEEIGICRYVKHKEAEWAVWLVASSEQARADAEEPSVLVEQLAASIEHVNGSKSTKPAVTPIRRKQVSESPDECQQPRLFDRKGTGTDGPAPQLAPAALSIPRTAAGRVQVRYGDMLSHIVRTVKNVLESEKLQLGDDPTQKIIVTLYIDACKQVRPVYDFSGEAGS